MKFFKKSNGSFSSEEMCTLLNQGDGPNLRCTNVFQSVVSTIPENCAVPVSLIKLGLLSQHLTPKSDSHEIIPKDISFRSSLQTTVPPETLKRVRWLLANHTAHLNDEQKKRIGELCSSSGLDQPPESGTTNIEKIESESTTTLFESIFSSVESASVECEYCGKEYESESSLSGHLAHCKQKSKSSEAPKSTDEKEYICDDCDESFRKKNALRVHKKRNCDAKSSENNQSSEKSSKKRPSFGKKIRKDRGSERVSGRNPFADANRLKDTGLHQGGG